MLYCSRCGQALPPGWRFCPECQPDPVPGNPRREAHLYLLLGNFSFAHQRPQLAALFYQAALEVDPANWEACFNLGCQAWQQGDVDRALTFWEASLKLNPDNYLAHFNLGTYFLYNRNLSAARYHLTRVRRIKPGYLAGRINLATVYLLLGLFEASRREYAFVLERDPDHKGARRGLALVNKVAIARR
ncbi:Tetratricopeptide TPR2 [Moorella glycerini]|uniref:TPR repeat-containing protein YrrB n=1 Tax=Neomoorella stamsii TaxID=1266720 RepID=A0A9X7P5V7_9FIRM|nr:MULTISPECIES: zinc ribbon domain-containing protein [Moorella]PRR72265.1 TPR repeat-containing protein YrrB [Moorella stamsii]CEP69566.1 Tetratricopeptide TPR2 [Moorella glycerini]